MAGGEYGGIKPLREAIANHYNAHHRQGKDSKYKWENVDVVPDGRAGLILYCCRLEQCLPRLLHS